MSISCRSTGDQSATCSRAGTDRRGTEGCHRPAAGSHRRIPGATGEGRRATAVLQAGDVRPTSRAVCTLARSEGAVRTRSRRRVGYQAGEPVPTTPMQIRRRLGRDESHDDQGSSSRNSGNTGRPSIRCYRRNCLAAAVEPSGSSSAPTSRSGRRWKRRSCTWSKRCGTPTAVPTATTARRCRPRKGRRRPWRKAPLGRASWPGW